MKQYIYAHRGASGYAPENTLEALSWRSSKARTVWNWMCISRRTDIW